MQHDAAVIELLILSEQEAQRIRTGEHDLHSAGRKHIREHSRAVDKILHQRHFIQEHIAAAVLLQHTQILVDLGQCVLCRDLDKRGLIQHLLIHIREDLTNHRRFPGAAKAVYHEHLILLRTKYVVLQTRIALTPAIFQRRDHESPER